MVLFRSEIRSPATALAVAVVLSAGCTHAPAPADLVLLDGKIVTMDDARPETSALAARGGRIVAVGNDTAIARYVGPGTQVLRLHGMLAVPGLIESHGHLTRLGILRMSVGLKGARSWEEIVARVRAAAAVAKPGAWIYGRGWHQEKWDRPPAAPVEGYPTGDALDEASPANPVVLVHASGHAAIANGAALAAAGIGSGTADPPGGRIVRDRSGRATGVLLETAADLVEDALDAARSHRPADEIAAETERAISIAQDECLAKGITTFEDAGSKLAVIDRMRAMAEAGRLKMRLWVMVRDDNALLRARLPDYRLQGIGDGHLTVRAIKRQIDGALGSRGAWLLAPYQDDPSTSGLETEPVADIEETARLAIENGFQLCVHAIGDRANRETLDLFERAFRAHPDKTGLRWRIEHAQHLDRADLPRFARLGVIASMQGIHCTSDGPWVPLRIGAARAEAGAYLWRDLIDSGAVVCNGTDVPVEDVDPIANFHASVTRKLPDGSVFYPKQKMTRIEALRSYTRNAAYAAFEEDVKGSLAAGKLADVTVLTEDILTVPDDEILKAAVAATIVGGQVVYRGPGAPP
jgi:predicted amidohydrolase YtcJ